MRVCDPPAGLFVSGLCHEGKDTILLLSPDEPAFWTIFTAAPEFRDGEPHPMDRWSKRVIRPYAAVLGGQALFPSDPPYPPIARWAVTSGQCHVSPIGMLVHATRGLFISFRGAVRVPGQVSLPAPAPDPCTPCPRPCLTACPVGAFRPDYDVARCHDALDRIVGADCMAAGCRARRACPLSAGCGRLPEQSAWHMKDFHP